MRNTVASSKHTEELRNGRGAVGQKSKSKFYGKMRDSPKKKRVLRLGSQGMKPAEVVIRDGWELGCDERPSVEC